MHFAKNIYNKDTLLGMLDMAMTGMIENDVCFSCPVNCSKPQPACFDEDACKSYLFEGLLKAVRKKRRKNVSHG